MKIWLIQNVIAPYREPLFEKISQAEGVDFRLILTSTKFKSRPQWKKSLSEYPFKVEAVPGVAISRSHDWETCVNPTLLFKAIRDRPDVVICGGYEISTIFIFLYALLFRGRYLIWTESTLETEQNLSRLKGFIRRTLIKKACCVVDAGDLSREYVTSLLSNNEEKQFFRSYNCIDTNLYYREESGQDPFADRDLPDKKILFVGRIDERKGVPQLLEAYRRLVEQDPGVSLLMVGEGPLEPLVREFKVQHELRHLYLEGWQEPLTVARYYRNCDLFALLSLKDPNPLVVFEALASGIPFLCTCKAGNALEFVHDGENGYVVDPMDIAQIVAKASVMLDWDAAKREAVKTFGREKLKPVNYDQSAAAFVQAARFCKISD